MPIDIGQVNGSSSVTINWGKELLSQKGGWTAAELGISLADTEDSVFTKADFEDALKKVCRKIKK